MDTTGGLLPLSRHYYATRRIIAPLLGTTHPRLRGNLGKLPAPSTTHLQRTLEGADGQEGQVLLLLGVADQVHVHQLLDLIQQQQTVSVSQPRQRRQHDRF